VILPTGRLVMSAAFANARGAPRWPRAAPIRWRTTSASLSALPGPAC
jgi:hypothetical protein